MINFNDQRDVLPSSLAVIGILGLTGSLIALIFVPRPSVKGIEGKKIQQQRTLINETDGLKTTVDDLETELEKTKFTEKVDLITPFVLDRVSVKANANKLTMSSFRPQRQVDNKSLMQLPYTVNFDGPFPSVIAFLRNFEMGEDKLAVNSLQLSSSEGAGDQVTATVGLVAYRDFEKVDPAKKQRVPLKSGPKPDPAAPKTTPVPMTGSDSGKGQNASSSKAPTKEGVKTNG